MTRGATVVVALVAVSAALLLLGEDSRLPEYAVLTQPKNEGDYDLVDLDAPRLVGRSLEFLAFAMRTPVLGRIISKVTYRNNNMLEVRRVAALIPDMPVYYPVFKHPQSSLDQETPLDLVAFSQQNLNVKTTTTKGFKHWSISDYTSRYASGELSPVQVAKAVLAAARELELGEIPSRIFIETFDDELMAAARASATRYAEGKPLGVLDGIPVAIKDEIEIGGHEMSHGTTFLGELLGKAVEDPASIARLRAAGAMIVGRTNMHQLGGGVTGYNNHYHTPRNPYNQRHYPGGSSSGSAVAVASGIVPLALGADAGGSTRIPAALCGVVGIKPTFLRVPPLGVSCPSLSTVGPIAGNVRDAAIAYAVISGGHKDLPHSLPQPAVQLHAFDSSSSLKGLKIGYFDSYLNHSSPEVAAVVRQSMKKLEDLGAELVETKLEYLLAIHYAHSVTVSSELAQRMDKFHSRLSEAGPEVQFVVGFARHYSAMDFIAAQRVRGFAMRQLQEKVFSQVDVFVTPTTGITAPEIPLDALERGELDAQRLSDIFRFTVYGNLAGTPGVAVPIGYDTQGLPISLQIQSAHWQEDVMLRVARATEVLYEGTQRQPQVYFSIIEDAKKHAP